MSDIPLASLQIVKRRNLNYKMLNSSKQYLRSPPMIHQIESKNDNNIKTRQLDIIPSFSFHENHNYIFLPLLFISFGFVTFFVINFNNIL